MNKQKNEKKGEKHRNKKVEQREENGANMKKNYESPYCIKTMSMILYEDTKQKMQRYLKLY